MLNQVVICGRLTKDPDIRQVEDGKTKVGSFSVAVDRDYVTSSGERPTDFFYCEAWNGTADFLSKYFHKGDAVQIVGRLVSKQWKNQEGKNQSSVTVRVDRLYFGERRRSKEARSGGPEQEYPLPPRNEPIPAAEMEDIYEAFPEEYPDYPPNMGYNRY